jgi:hypothetical protein
MTEDPQTPEPGVKEINADAAEAENHSAPPSNDDSPLPAKLEAEDSQTPEPSATEMNADTAEGENHKAPPTDDDSPLPPKLEAEVSEPPTLRQFFDIPEKATDKSDDNWTAFQQKLAEETKGIKWTAAMPDLGSKIGDLLDIRIHDLLLAAWKKVEAVRKALEDSKQTPDKAVYLDLTEHSIDYETKPFIDVKIKSASVKKLTLNVALNLKIKGFVLKIQNGAVREMQTGRCEAKGTIKYEKFPIAEKKLEPIKFPLSIRIPSLISIPDPTVEEPPTEKVVPKPNELKEPETEDQLERIEL